MSVVFIADLTLFLVIFQPHCFRRLAQSYCMSFSMKAIALCLNCKCSSTVNLLVQRLSITMMTLLRHQQSATIVMASQLMHHLLLITVMPLFPQQIPEIIRMPSQSQQQMHRRYQRLHPPPNKSIPCQCRSQKLSIYVTIATLATYLVSISSNTIVKHINAIPCTRAKSAKNRCRTW